MSENKIKHKKVQKQIFEWLEEFAMCAIFVAVTFPFLFKVASVSGVSMLPNLENDDRIIVSCLNFPYEQGDVIVISDVLKTPIIKRVIATENQKVDIDFENGVVYIDEMPLDEEIFGLENGITRNTYTSDAKVEFPVTVPEGHIFVLGDNRSVSEDSRYVEVGMIDTRNVVGKAVLRIFPLDKFGLIE